MKKFLAVLVTVVAMVLTGCSTPKVVHSEVVTPPVYTYGQEPSKRTIEDGGRQYRAYVRRMQDQRLEHEFVMKAMEYQAEEARYAKEKGVAVPQQPHQAFAPFAPPAQVYLPPPPSVVMAPTVPHYVPAQPDGGAYYPPAYYQQSPMYYNSGGGGCNVQQRQLFGVRFNAVVNPAYGGGGHRHH